MQFSVIFLLACCALISTQRCDSITCGVDIGITYAPNMTNCDCSPTDYSGHFTPCNSGKKNLYFFWKPPAVCHNLQLPPPAFDVPCVLTCQDGTFFNSTTSTCDNCKGGTFSTTLLSYTQWTSIPGQFKTTCTNPYNPCQQWQPKGTYIDSGKNYDWGQTRLVMEIEMYTDGNVTFEYEVEAEEGWDFFGFYLNGVEKLRVSNQLTWKALTIPLARGHHELTWLYSKDSIYSKGEDKAKIQKILITGAIDVVTSCPGCPVGTFSLDGQTSATCRKCAAGTFNPIEGQTGCLPCPPLQTSFEGASKCIAMSPPCRTTDYYSYNLPCDGVTQTRKFNWISPQLCNATHPNSVVLLNPISVECDQSCPPGQQFVSGSCQYCPEKTFSTNGGSCATCTAGKALSSKVTTFSNFSSLPDTWLTGCHGDCVSNWRALGSSMDSGFGNGISETWVEYPVQISTPQGQTVINYEFSCLADAGVVQFWVDGVIQSKFTCSGCSTNKQSISIPMAMGSHTIRTSFVTNSLASQDLTCNRVTINQVSIVGTATGGSTSCQACPAGTISSSGDYTCPPCNAGFFSNSGDATCTQCGKNTFSYTQSPKCYNCGNGMTSPEGSSECLWKFNGTSCYYEEFVGSVKRQFDWEPLSHEMMGRTFQSDAGEVFGINLDTTMESYCPVGSFVCRYNPDGTILDLGNTASIRLGDQHLHIDYTNYNVKDLNGSQPIQVAMDLYCDPDRIDFNPENDIAVYGGVNNYNIEIFTYHGCPLCTEDDWEEKVGQCEDGKRKHIWVKRIDNIDEFVCAKGVTKETTFSDCSGTAAFPIWAIFLIILPFLIGFAAIVIVGGVIYYRIRRLQSQFQLLVEDEDMGHEKL